MSTQHCRCVDNSLCKSPWYDPGSSDSPSFLATFSFFSRGVHFKLCPPLTVEMDSFCQCLGLIWADWVFLTRIVPGAVVKFWLISGFQPVRGLSSVSCWWNVFSPDLLMDPLCAGSEESCPFSIDYISTCELSLNAQVLVIATKVDIPIHSAMMTRFYIFWRSALP